MAKNVKCKYCLNLKTEYTDEGNPFEWCEKVEDSPYPDISRDCIYFAKRKPQTNADIVRSMTDEELAEFICRKYFVPHCPIPICKNDDDDCVECWLSWLKEPVKEGKT